MNSDELRAQATRLRRIDLVGSMQTTRDIWAGADALDRLADVIEHAETVRDAIPYPPPESADWHDVGAQGVAIEVLRILRGDPEGGTTRV